MTDSQLFGFSGGAGPLSLQPQNQKDSCLVVKGNAIDIAKCNAGDAGQTFTFGGAAAGGGGKNTNGGNNNNNNNNNNGGGNNNNGGSNNNNGGNKNNGGNENNGGNSNNAGDSTSTTCTKTTRTVTATPSQNADSSSGAAAQPTKGAGGGAGSGAGGIPTANPTDPVPVSRAGGTLQPTAAAESHQRDETAKRAFSSVSIRAPNGQCLFIDPTAGDFRQNLIPVSLVDCTGSPNEKFDVITEGKHNKPRGNQQGAALVVSALVSGEARLCLGRRRVANRAILALDPRLH